jgi:uncharacterized protein (DUF4415 family)
MNANKVPRGKTVASFDCLDTDVLASLKAAVRGYQTRINRILRAAMESQPKRRSRAASVSKKRAGSRD